MKKRFKVSVIKKLYLSCDVEVEADNEMDAMVIAEEEAPSLEDSDFEPFDCEFDAEISEYFYEQEVKFEYEGVSHKFKFTPEGNDWWTFFQYGDYSFDVHYHDEDEGKGIFVYYIVYEDNQWNRIKLITIQPIYKP